MPVQADAHSVNYRSVWFSLLLRSQPLIVMQTVQHRDGNKLVMIRFIPTQFWISVRYAAFRLHLICRTAFRIKVSRDHYCLYCY